ncbi:MAG: YdeI/OmpD-associated family protein [Pseudomonadota bacterium]
MTAQEQTGQADQAHQAHQAHQAGEDAPADFPSQAHWAQWLAAHHASSRGIWLRIAKQGAPQPSVSHPQALEVALCFGWIDGQRKSLDAHYWLQRFTPRGARSIWSKVNREKALAYIAAGRMQASGLAEVERAQRDGRWDAAYDPGSTAQVAPDLQRALDDNPGAAAFFVKLDARNRYAVLFRIHTAKKPETRARRIAQFVAMLARGDTLHPAARARA